MAHSVTDATFQTEVEQAQQPVLVDFWAPWCGPCRMLAPVLDSVGSDLDGKLQIVKLNVDENPQTAARFGIMSIPTLLLFNAGKVVEQVVGLQNKQQLMQMLTPHLG